MNQADEKYKELVEDIINNGYSDKGEKVRTVYDSDGAPAYTKKVFAKQIQFDNSELPILTTKFVGYKTAIKELILFWIKQTVKEEDFHADNVQIWNQWFKDGNLGRSYGYQFESHRNKNRGLIQVDKKKYRKNTNFLTDDELLKAVLDEGDLNSIKNLTEKEFDFLRKEHSRIINHVHYNQEKISIDLKWLKLENFIRDARYLPQWFLAKEDLDNYVLSLSYYESNRYCFDSVVWLDKQEDEHYKSYQNGDKIVFEDVDGTIDIFDKRDINGISEKYKSDITQTFHSVMNNNAKSLSPEIKDFYISNTRNKLWRKELSRNQVVELILNIKNNPQSRRLLTNFFNYSDVPYKSLQECAYGTNWDVAGNKLNLILIQRSLDVGLGCSFNWVQYNILQRMIAQVTGLELGTFTHQIGNAHIYDRHEEALLEQVNQLPYASPTLLINEEVKDFFDFTVDDFELVCYTNRGKIKLEVAV